MVNSLENNNKLKQALSHIALTLDDFQLCEDSIDSKDKLLVKKSDVSDKVRRVVSLPVSTELRKDRRFLFGHTWDWTWD